MRTRKYGPYSKPSQPDISSLPENDARIYFPPGLIDAAYEQVCRRRINYPHNADIWDLRFHWTDRKQQLLDSLNRGTYRLSPVQLVRKADGTTVALWSAQDALVIQVLTRLLEPLLPVHRTCEHVRGHGGGKQSRLRVHDRILSGRYTFVCRTDVRGYYGSINPHLLYNQVTSYVSSPVLLSLLHQFLHYTVEDGGTFRSPERGISRGASLSPLLGAFYLYEVDRHFAENPHIRYVRYMDDFLILAKTRWHLRRVLRELHGFMEAYGFRLHPDKTAIGRISRGFDWMGFWFSNTGMQSLAPRAIKNRVAKILRLFEQTRGQPELRVARLWRYLRRAWPICAMCRADYDTFGHDVLGRLPPGTLGRER